MSAIVLLHALVASSPLLRLRGGAASNMPKGIDVSIVQGNVEAIQSALSQGKLDGEMVNKEGNTAMHIACQHGALGVLDYLLSEGVGAIDAQRSSDGGTPLMYASQNGHAECVERLLKAGANVDLAQTEGSAAVHYACRHGHAKCLELLLAAKADANVMRTVDGISPLMVASFNGETSCAEMLLKRGKNVNVAQRSSNDLAALDYACREGHAETVALLLKHKAPRDQGQAKGGGTCPIHWATEAGHAACLSALLEAGASPNTPREDGSTALFYAAIRGRSECMRLLLDAGADAGTRRTNGVTALHLAAQQGYDECVSLLINAGAPVNAAVGNKATERMVDVTTPLDLATQTKARGVMTLLKQAGGLTGAELSAGQLAK